MNVPDRESGIFDNTRQCYDFRLNASSAFVLVSVLHSLEPRAFVWLKALGLRSVPVIVSVVSRPMPRGATVATAGRKGERGRVAGGTSGLDDPVW